MTGAEKRLNIPKPFPAAENGSIPVSALNVLGRMPARVKILPEKESRELWRILDKGRVAAEI